MENPTFRLESVVHSKNEMEDFEGPLTLILQLLSKNKIEIQDIRISELLDQYMAYLDEMKAMDLEIASEFVTMASHLVYIKARMLLSNDEEPSELEELIMSLERLKNRDVFDSVKAVTDTLGIMYTRGAGCYVKQPEYLPVNKEYTYFHEKGDILAAITRVLTRENIAEVMVQPREFTMPQRIVYPVTEKAEEIISALIARGDISLTTLLEESKSRTELVATFIALLELCREGRICLVGEGDDTTVSHLAEVE